MRQPAAVLRYLVLLLALGFAARAYADDRAEARARYQSGVKFYAAGDYRGAIREFSAAQQLAPADLNNYNLALCYDKLGDAEPAIQYYRAFLDRQPSTDKRPEIEASISRLEAAVRSAASKKAEEAKRAEDARRTESIRPPSPPLGPSPSPVGPASPGPDTDGKLPDEDGVPAGPDANGASGERKKPGPAVAGSLGGSASGSSGTPSSGSPVSTGDSQLDRVNSINIDEIRGQRMGGASSGMVDPRSQGIAQSGQPGQPGQQYGQSGQSGQPPIGPQASTGSELPPPGGDQPKKEGPVYKKWWFWGIMAASVYVGYRLLSDTGSNDSVSSRIAPPAPSGATLLSW